MSENERHRKLSKRFSLSYVGMVMVPVDFRFTRYVFYLIIRCALAVL